MGKFLELRVWRELVPAAGELIDPFVSAAGPHVLPLAHASGRGLDSSASVSWRYKAGGAGSLFIVLILPLSAAINRRKS